MTSKPLSFPLRILLVEDSPYDAHFFETTLRHHRLSCTIVHEAAAEKALERLKNSADEFDLVVTDHNLPGITGLDFCRLLLGGPFQLPVVLLTGSGSERLAVEALKAGVNDYLVKDVNGGYLELLPLILPNVVRKFRERLARKMAEAALRQSEMRYRAIVEDQTELICRFDPDARLTFVNGAFARFHDRPAARILDNSIYRCIVPEDHGTLRRLLDHIDPGAPMATVELRARDSRGDIRWQEWTIRALFEDDGRLLEYQSVGRDITQRKQSEENLIARNEELDAYAHTVAHDLKNPLSTLSGFVSALKEGYVSDAPDQMERVLSAIDVCSSRAVSIVDELLLMASIRKEDIVQAPIDMGQVMGSVQTRMEPMMREHGGVLQLPATWPTASGHAPWVEEIWVNYISNGLKYGGKPPVLVAGSETRADGSIQFWLRDNGPGLTAAEQSMLFTPFERLNQVGHNGQGLGLSIVQRIVAKLGGTVGVDSQPGLGSAFFFTLPQAESIGLELTAAGTLAYAD